MTKVIQYLGNASVNLVHVYLLYNIK